MSIGRHIAKYEIIIKRDCEVFKKVHVAIVSKCIFDDDNDDKFKIVCGYLRSKAGAMTWRTAVSEVRALTPPALLDGGGAGAVPGRRPQLRAQCIFLLLF